MEAPTEDLIVDPEFPWGLWPCWPACPGGGVSKGHAMGNSSQGNLSAWGFRLLQPWGSVRSSFSKKKKRFYLFLERGEGKEKEWERNINVWLPLTRPAPGTWSTPQACALTGNRTSDSLVRRPMLSPLSHTSQRCLWLLSIPFSGNFALGGRGLWGQDDFHGQKSFSQFPKRGFTFPVLRG